MPDQCAESDATGLERLPDLNAGILPVCPSIGVINILSAPLAPQLQALLIRESRVDRHADVDPLITATSAFVGDNAQTFFDDCLQLLGAAAIEAENTAVLDQAAGSFCSPHLSQNPVRCLRDL